MKKQIKSAIKPLRKLVYNLTGKKPWSYGYNDQRWDIIASTIRDSNKISQFAKRVIPEGYGIGFDERIVEYPWIFSKMGQLNQAQILDAGSTFNFSEIVSHDVFHNNALTIYTFYPEPNQYIQKRISYVFGDLRSMPFRDNQFSFVVCQSTIEHIDMDNSIYGYDLNKIEDEKKKSYEYLHVVDELNRVLRPGGTLLITFPYGVFENHGFFQQFDQEMVSRITEKLKRSGNVKLDYLQYATTGWKFSDAEACNTSISYNPHTGKGKGNDGAAHCRAVCCIEFIKST